MLAALLQVALASVALADCGSERRLTALHSEAIVLDDVNASGTGWHRGTYNPCLQDAYGNMFHHDWAADKGSVTAQYTFDPPRTGCYMIEEHHPGENPQCSQYLPRASRVDIDYCKGKSAYTYMDHSRNGGQWTILGALPFYHGWQGRIKLSNHGTSTNCQLGTGCFWIADAFRMTWVSDLANGCRVPDTTTTTTTSQMTSTTTTAAISAAQIALRVTEDAKLTAVEAKTTTSASMHQIIVDDDDVNVSAPWQHTTAAPLSCSQEGWKQNFLYLDPSQSTSAETSVEFLFNPPQSGCYLVEEFHPGSSCGHMLSPEIPLTIHYCKGMKALAEVDQTQNGNQWNSIGTWMFFQGHPGKVVLSHPQVGMKIAAADAFRFTYLGRGCHTARGSAVQFERLAQNPVAVVVDDFSATANEAAAVAVPNTCNRNAFAGGLMAASVGEASATFVFEPASTGCYRIDTYHPENTDCMLAQDVTVQVDWCIGRRSYHTIPLRDQGNRWNTIGHYKFFAGAKGGISSRRMSSSPVGEYWVADAFRFTKVAETCDAIPNVGLFSLRIVGAELDRLNASVHDNGLTQYPDVHIALHDAIMDATNLTYDSIRLLGLRKGSVIADVEVRGTMQAITHAISTIWTQIGSQQENNFKMSLCRAVLASSDCEVEVMGWRVLPAPRGTPEQAIPGTEQAESLSFGVIASILVGFIVIVFFAAFYRLYAKLSRKGRKIAWKDPVQTMANCNAEMECQDVINAETGNSVMKWKDESDEVDSVAGSTATPTSLNDLDVMSVASGICPPINDRWSPTSSEKVGEP